MSSLAAFRNIPGQEPASPIDRSAVLGLLLIVAPASFMFSMVMKHELGVELRVFDAVGGFFEYFDRLPLTRAWFSPVVFVLLPLTAVWLNIRAMLQTVWSREQRVVTLTIRVRVPNLVSLAAASGVFGGIFLYQLAETFLGRG